MPTKPKRPCSYPGCPRLTNGRYCEEHAKLEARRYEKYDRDPGTRQQAVSMAGRGSVSGNGTSQRILCARSAGSTES